MTQQEIKIANVGGGFQAKRAMAKARIDDDDDDTQVYKRPWVGLTAEEIASIPLNEYTLQTAERLLRSKNT